MSLLQKAHRNKNPYQETGDRRQNRLLSFSSRQRLSQRLSKKEVT